MRLDCRLCFSFELRLDIRESFRFTPVSRIISCPSLPKVLTPPLHVHLEKHPVTVSRCLFRVHLHARNTHFFLDIPPHPLLLREPTHGPKVSLLLLLCINPKFSDFSCDPNLFSTIYVLALGGYSTSVIKDLFCSPRPLAPPVTRLSESYIPSY